MAFPPKKVIVFGATSGIGVALAEKYIAAGSHVLAVGRREERLESLQSKHGKSKVSFYTFDISGVKEIQEFVEKVLEEHQDLDSAVLNAGIQHSFDFSEPETVDLNKLDHEWTTNYISYVHLTHALLPHLLKKKNSSVVYISSGLALVHSARQLNYSATKAALHAFVLSLRRQLCNKTTKVVEIIPPAVKTELHDSQPGLKMLVEPMSLEDFTKEAWEGLTSGKDQIFVGSFVKKMQDGFEGQRQEMFETLNKAWTGGYGRQ